MLFFFKYKKHKTNAQSKVESHLNCLQLIPLELHFDRMYPGRRVKLSWGAGSDRRRGEEIGETWRKSLSNHVPLRQQ